MSKKATYLLGILLTIILGTLLYYFFCCKDSHGNDNLNENEINLETGVVTPEVKEATINLFTITDANSKLQFKAADNFNFKTSSFSFLDSLSPDLDNQLSKLSKYVIENPNKRIDVIGLYTKDEENTSAFPDLGLARANSIKNYLNTKAVPSRLINMSSELRDNIYPDANGLLSGPVNFSISTVDEGDTSAKDNLKTLGEEIKANPLTLYFKTGAATINLTAEQRQKVSKIVTYTDKVDNSSINVIGHTDNTGNRNSNIQLGKRRADFVADFLARNGISRAKIQTSSKGPDQPIADNATDEGKAKNRRVIVTIN